MKRVPPVIDATHPAHTRRASKIAVTRRLEALLTPDLAERVIDSLVKFVTAPLFWILNLVVSAWWVIVNSELVPGIEAFDPSLYLLFFSLIPGEALCLVVLVALNRHYLKRKTDRLNQIKALLSKLEDD